MNKIPATLPLALGFLLATGTACSGAAPKPNFVFILADDQGWTGTSVRMMPERPDTASDFHHTPVLEKLARQGMRFSNAYAPHPMCSPTRHAIQFGMSPATLNITRGARAEGVNAEEDDAFVNVLKRADPDYAAAHFGKWHIYCAPSKLGYDASDGQTGNAEGTAPNPDVDPKRIFSLTERSIGFMEEQVRKSRPFYLQVSHWAVHGPNQALPSTLEKYSGKNPGERHSSVPLAAMTEDFDRGIGLLLDKIEELGIADHTYIIYMSDNGAPGGRRSPGANLPLKGAKSDAWEGGVRVPMIVRGPGIAAGSSSDAPVIGYDLFPTVLDFVRPGFALPESLEGGSLRKIWENEGRGTVARDVEHFVFHFPSGVGGMFNRPESSIRLRNHKLEKFWDTGEVQLFDLDTDLEEEKNLAESLPEVAAQLHARLNQHIRNGAGEQAFAALESGELAERGGGPRGRGRGPGRRGAGGGPRLFPAIDADGDGAISGEEWDKAFAALGNPDQAVEERRTTDEPQR